MFMRHPITLLALFTSVLLVSCATHVPCGVETDKKAGLQSKKYKASLAERDSLCTTNQKFGGRSERWFNPRERTE
jgi:hypothetical protein